MRPFHITACADAENVKLGTTTGPGRSVGERLDDEHETRGARAERDDVLDAEAFRDAHLEFRDERTVGEHAELVRRLEAAHDALERRACGPHEGQSGRERGGPAEQRRQLLAGLGDGEVDPRAGWRRRHGRTGVVVGAGERRLDDVGVELALARRTR